MLTETEYKSRLQDSGLNEAEIERQWQARLMREYDHNWHVAINRHIHPTDGEWLDHDKTKFMYSAKEASQSVDGIAYTFKREREGKLPKTFRRCSCCPTQKHVEDNHTFCCLGVECRKCEFLLALDKAEMPPDQIDRAKAWTCVAHILANGGDMAGEGFILTVDDRMFWDGVYESMAMSPEEGQGKP